jgi:PTS system fructose-specific IIA component
MSVISDEFILLNTKFTSRDEAFKGAALKLYNAGRITDINKFIEGIYEREKLFSTYMENGIAIPHCKIKEVKEATVVIIRNSKPLVWQNEEIANIMIILAIPAENPDNIHLRILANIAQALLNKDFVDVIKNTNNAEAIIDKFRVINSVSNN